MDEMKEINLLKKVNVYNYLKKHPQLFKICLENDEYIDIDYIPCDKNGHANIKCSGIDNIKWQANTVFLIFHWIIAKCEIEAEKFINENYVEK